MPNWKKVLVSGSDASLNLLFVETATTSSTLQVNGDSDFNGKVEIYNSGSTVFDVQGSQGQLFSITDSLSGSLFAVNDISGIPILEVFSDDTVKLGTYGSEGLIVTGSDASVTGDLDITGTLSKGAGSFKINHPDPEKTDKNLWHSFVESPTAGDNIYRWQIQVKDNFYQIKLPDYYKFLNENHQIWISPVKHFGQGYGEVNEDETFIEITTNQDGIYNVLLIGTRKDETAKRAWKGTEREKTKKYKKGSHN